MCLDHYEPNSTPRLSLSKLPCKPKPIQLLTPPLHPAVSIPFQWEEAPGKPRAWVASPLFADPAAYKNNVARCLDLPPRLLHDGAKITIMPSPAVVFDRPYVGPLMSLACTFSFRKGVVSGGGDGSRVKKSYCGRFGSRRWGSFKGDEKLGRGSFGFSQSLGEIFMSEKNVKVTRLTRVRSFFNFSSMNSHL
ncbi:hypothetical protein ACS0TY_000071 [Phlomoides rotata]